MKHCRRRLFEGFHFCAKMTLFEGISKLSSALLMIFQSSSWLEIGQERFSGSTLTGKHAFPTLWVALKRGKWKKWKIRLTPASGRILQKHENRSFRLLKQESLFLLWVKEKTFDGKKSIRIGVRVLLLFLKAISYLSKAESLKCPKTPIYTEQRHLPAQHPVPSSTRITHNNFCDCF